MGIQISCKKRAQQDAGRKQIVSGDAVSGAGAHSSGLGATLPLLHSAPSPAMMPGTMSDRTADRTQQASDSTTLSVPEAAERLGITPDAVRARLHRGTLEGEKVAGMWQVHLAPPPPPIPVGATGTQQDAAGIRQDTDRQPTDALIARLESEIDHLRGELAARTEENRRKDHLLAAALERLPALGASEDAPVDAIRHPAGGGGVHMAPRTSQDAYGDPVAAEVAIGAGWRRWWRRVMGR